MAACATLALTPQVAADHARAAVQRAPEGEPAPDHGRARLRLAVVLQQPPPLGEDPILGPVAAHPITEDEVGDEVSMRDLVEGGVEALVLITPHGQECGGKVDVRLGDAEARTVEREAIHRPLAVDPRVVLADSVAEYPATEVVPIHPRVDECQADPRAALTVFRVVAAAPLPVDEGHHEEGIDLELPRVLEDPTRVALRPPRPHPPTDPADRAGEALWIDVRRGARLDGPVRQPDPGLGEPIRARMGPAPREPRRPLVPHRGEREDGEQEECEPASHHQTLPLTDESRQGSGGLVRSGMLALRFDGAPKVHEVDPPRCGPGEALIRVRRAGICSTDLEITRGYMAFEGTLGHELVGEVLEAPDASWVGRRVTAEINLGCGACKRCARSMSRHCATRTVMGILGRDGCFAELIALPLENLHAIPDEVSDELAVFAEPLAAAYEILEQVRVDPSWRVAVLGDGKLGSLVAMVLAQTGAELTVLGRHESKLARLAPLGLRTSLARDVRGDFDLVVEATGSPAGFAQARELLRPRGTLVLKSTFFGETQVAMAPLVIDEITVVGSRCGPFPPAIRALADGRVDPSILVEDTYALADGVAALERAAERGVTKVLLAP